MVSEHMIFVYSACDFQSCAGGVGSIGKVVSIENWKQETVVSVEGLYFSYSVMYM